MAGSPVLTTGWPRWGRIPGHTQEGAREEGGRGCRGGGGGAAPGGGGGGAGGIRSRSALGVACEA